MRADPSTGDLHGIVLLDLAGIGPAARCARVLADLGARWIRLLPPPAAGRPRTAWHAYGAWRGAEEVELDLKSPVATEVFLRLAEQADVVIEGFRPGVADRLGIGYQSVRAVNDQVVYCAATGYGQTGPRAGEAGHDLNYQALGGALATGDRRSDGGPALPGLTLADSAGGGWQAAIRVLAALVARQRTGQGAFLDVAASEGVLHLMALAVDEHLATGEAPTAGNTPFTGRYACYDVYATRDGWVAVAALEPKFFANLCAVLDLSALTAKQYDLTEQSAIRAALAAAFARRTRAEWELVLAGVDCCVSPVLSIDELASDPHWQARGAFREYEHPIQGPTRQVAPFGGSEGGWPGPVPDGATTPEALLASFGLDTAEVAAPAGAGVAV